MSKCYKKGDILLLKFPFTSGKSSKVRPALVLRTQKDSDIICLPITSMQRDNFSDKKILKTHTKGFIFPLQSYIRTQKIATIHENLVAKKLGELESEFFKEIHEQVITFLCK